MSNRPSGSNSRSSLTRRNFIKVAGAAMALPGSAWGATDPVSASNRITIGVIGWGMMGPANTKAFLARE